jgi:hypothetical protein
MNLNFNNPISITGTRLTPLPKQNISAVNYNKKFTLWLIENAKLECKGKDHLTLLLSFIKPNKRGEITVFDKDNLNMVLFGSVNIKIDYENM